MAKSQRKKKTSKKGFKQFRDFYRDPRTVKITGGILVLLSLFLLLAFVSFLFTWKADSNVLYLSRKEFFDLNPGATSNWMRAIGAKLAFLFMYQGFGLSAFVFPYLFFAIGMNRYTQNKIFNLFKVLKFVLISLFWFSLFLGLLFISSKPMLAGSFGIGLYEWCKAMIGSIGVIMLLLFALVAIAIWEYNFDIPRYIFDKYRQIKNKEKSKTEDHEFSDIDEDDDVQAGETLFEKDNIELVQEESINPEESDDLGMDVEDSRDEVKTEEPKEEEKEEEGADMVLEIKDKKEVETVDGVERHGIDTEFDPQLELRDYKFPPLELLEEYAAFRAEVSKDELEKSKNLIVQTLSNYKIGISSIRATIGPTVTLFEIVPASGVRISRIKNLEDDIALSLAALGIRIIAPIPGKGTIGIEVPNKKPEIVSMKSVLISKAYQESEMELPVCLGKTISNEPYIADLAKMPHLLMAGATGQGKSVGLNALLVSLIYKKHPAEVKFVLVDPKKVELTLYQKIERHYLAKLPGDSEAIITDNKIVVQTLNSLCVEMDKRYALLQSAFVRNIKEYNVKFIKRKLNPNDGHRYLPYIVVVVDEVADLIMTAGKEVEHPIGRLAQLARAIGIHLVLATQRPSVNIITGTIKANFPARIAFRVSSKIDSRTILDGNGADQLIGKGDMLFSNGSDIIRLQCPFVDTPEIEKITSYIGDQRAYPEAYILPEVADDSGGGEGGSYAAEDRDALFEDAARIVVQHQQGSTSLLQRRLKIGYNRAGRLIDQLEHANIVGPFEGSKARAVLLPDEYALEQYLNQEK
jgi:DNA segregation ATPase FtsK/SpoIIIE, S-DNA-T family